MTDRRLIEDFIPIKEISVEAAREKSIRKGHISTLHLWWARRPLVAARAAVFASLVAAPESHQKRSHLKKQMIDLCKWEAVPETISKAKDAILEAQRERLGLPVGTKLQDVPPPKVLDMFAGGGAIPLEALRLGCETFAVDLNPVAHIIELCTLVYPQRYGKRLADEVELWGNWVIEKVRSQIGDLYPRIEKPSPPAPLPLRERGGLGLPSPPPPLPLRERGGLGLPSPPPPLPLRERGDLDLPSPPAPLPLRERGDLDLPSPPAPLPLRERGDLDLPSPPAPLPLRERGDLDLPSPPAPLPLRERGDGVAEKWEISEALRLKMVEVAKNLRRESTLTEKVLWEQLRTKKRGYKVRRQQPIGVFVVDFYIPQSRLIVEIDGSVHDDQQVQDRERQTLLEELGLRFLRFSAIDVEQNLDRVLRAIDDQVAGFDASIAPPLSPPHEGGEARVRVLDLTIGLGISLDSLSSPYEGGEARVANDDHYLPITTNHQLDLLLPSPLMGEGLGERVNSLTPVAYLWTRTVKCPNPACGADVPLVRQTWLCKKAKKYVALRVIPNHVTMRVEFEVVEASSEKDLGFDPAAGSARGQSTCRHCGTTVNSAHVKAEGKAGRIGQQLMATVCTTQGAKGKTYLAGKHYESSYIPDEVDLKKRLEKLCEETGLTVPNEPIFSGDTRAFFTHLYGLDDFGKLFTSRQLLALMTFVKWVRLAHDEMVKQGYEGEFAKAIATYLGIMCDRLSDRGSTICRWDNLRDMSSNTFSRQALPMVWDFAENNPLGNASGNVNNALDWILNFLSRESSFEHKIPAKAQRGSATSLQIETNLLDAVITDPPYFDSVPYADLSDFFYVWLKRSIGHLYSEHFSSQLTPKKQEAIMEPSRHGGDKKKAAQAYEDMMHQAFCEAFRVLKSNGNLVVVYAHKTTSGWSTLIDSLRRAGFMITEAWPLDTEMSSRLRANNSAALASSIFLVARKRNTPHPLTPSPTRGEGGQDSTLTPPLPTWGEGGQDSTLTPPLPTWGEGGQDSALTPPLPTWGEGGQDSTLTPPLPAWERGQGGEGLIGDFAIDVKPQLEQIITERVKTLMAEGVSGADLVIACIGAGLRAYTQFDKVELPNGDELDANSFLGEVQKAVVEAVLTSVMQCDKRGVSQVDKPTQYYIMARYEYGEAIVEFDEANTLAKGVGVELDGAGGLTDGKLALIQKTKNQVQLRDYSDRGADPELGIQKTEKQQTFNHKPEAIGKTPTAIDMLHRLLWLTEHKPQDIPEYLSLAQPDANQLRLVAQSLAGRALTPETSAPLALNGRGAGGEGLSRTVEQQAIDTLLASWKRAIEDNLFTRS